MARITLAALFLMSFGGGVFAEEADCSTWRWTASEALDAQRPAQPAGANSRPGFEQRYERYSFSGQPEASR